MLFGEGGEPSHGEDAPKLGQPGQQAIVSGRAAGLEVIAAREGLNERSARMTLSLAFLAPDIVKAAVDGTLPSSLGVSRLMDMPTSWAEQCRKAGLPAAP